jgi:RNA polymerase sigma factor (sigma-70 family)
LDVGEQVADRRLNPEENTACEQRIALMYETLQQLPPRDREILIRYYLYEETRDEICQRMGLTETQFRLFKSRAKARLGGLGKKKLQRKTLVPFCLRIPTGL